jgi:hypothetical protein
MILKFMSASLIGVFSIDFSRRLWNCPELMGQFDTLLLLWSPMALEDKNGGCIM